MRTRIGDTRLRIGNVRLAIGSGSAAPAPTYASMFTTALSRSGGQQGDTAVFSIIPGAGGFPGGITPQFTLTGFAAPATQTTTAGSKASLTFNLVATGYPGTNAYASVVLAGMTTQNGPQQFAIAASQTVTPITPSTPTGAGNRFDLVLDRSVAALGDTVNGSVIINGLWPTASGRTVTLSNGVTINLPTSGSAPAAFSFVLTAPMASTSEMSLTAINNAGLYNPYPAPLTVFAAGSGSAQSLTASSTRLTNATYQRDRADGTPTGFPSSFNKGWGEVWFNVGQSGPALFMRLYDANSSGITSTAGTGTALTGVVQVHGPFSAGPVRVLPPASAYNYYADLATDAAFTNPVRVAQLFRVGVVTAVDTRSYETGIANPYSDGGRTFPLIYSKTSVCISADPRYGLGADAGGNNSWRMDGVDAAWKLNGDYQPGSSGSQEWGRALESQLGVCQGIVGMAAIGYGLDAHIAHDGTFNGGFRDTVNNIVGGKFRYLYVAVADWDGHDAYGTTSVPSTPTLAENRTRYLNGIDWIARTYPACAVQGWAVGNTGWEIPNGSAQITGQNNDGSARNQAVIMQEIEPVNPMVVSKDNTLWNEFNNFHSTMASRLDYVRPSFRQIMAAEMAVMGGFQTLERGPVLAATGTLNASARTITFGVHVAAGANLMAVGASYSDPNITYNTASTGEIASCFGVYIAGQVSGTGKAVQISGVTIDNSAKTITLTLSGTTGIIFQDGTTAAMPSGFWVNYGSDFFTSNLTIPPNTPRGAMLADDRLGNGIPYGWMMRQAIDRVAN